MKRALVLAAALLSAPLVASAQRAPDPSTLSAPASVLGRDAYTGLDCYVGRSQTCALTTQPFRPAYQLLGRYAGAGATASGAAVGPVPGGTYVFRIMGTFAGCTATLQATDADGVSKAAIDTETASATKQVVVEAPFIGMTAPNVNVALTGCTGTPAIWATLGQVN